MKYPQDGSLSVVLIANVATAVLVGCAVVGAVVLLAALIVGTRP